MWEVLPDGEDSFRNRGPRYLGNRLFIPIFNILLSDEEEIATRFSKASRLSALQG